MLLRKIQTHPFDLDTSQIDINLIEDKKERNLPPSIAKVLAAKNKDSGPETSLSVRVNFKMDLSFGQPLSKLCFLSKDSKL